MLSEPSMTWKFVRICPSPVIKKPEPEAAEVAYGAMAEEKQTGDKL